MAALSSAVAERPVTLSRIGIGVRVSRHGRPRLPVGRRARRAAARRRVSPRARSPRRRCAGSRRSTRSWARSSRSTPSARSRRRARSARRRARRSPASRSRSRPTRRGAGCAWTTARASSPATGRPRRPPRAPPARRGLRDRRHDEDARVRDPADHRAAPRRPARNPWDPSRTPGGSTRRRGGGRRRRAAADRPRQRRRRLDPHPGRLLRARRPQAEPRARLARARHRRLVPGLRRRAVAHRADTAPRSTSSRATRPATRPGRRRPAEPYTHAINRDPGHAADRDDVAQPARVAADPEVVARPAPAAAAAARARPRGRGGRAGAARRRSRCRSSSPSSAPHIALGHRARELLAGREPATTTSSRCRARCWSARARPPSTSYLGARGDAAGLARGVGRLFADCDVMLTPVLAERPLRDRRARTASAPTPLDAFAARARSRPTRGSSTSPASRRSRSRSGFGADGLPRAVQLVGRPLGEDTLLQVARAARGGAAVGATAARAIAERV